MAKYPNSKQFRRELETGNLDRLYLLLGGGDGVKKKTVVFIIDKVLPGGEERRNSVGRFHLDSDDLSAAADFALSQSMFFPEKVCVISHVEKIKESKSPGSLFHELIDTLPDHTTLILTTKENRPPDIFTPEHLKLFKIVQFWRFFDQDIYNYIVMNIKKMGLTIDDRAIELLIKLTGKDIKKIDDALDIIHYSGETGVIDSAMIRNYIHDVKTISIFDFIDALFRKDKISMKLLRRIQEDGVPDLLILNMICRQAESVEKIHEMVRGGMSFDEAFEKSGVYAKNRDKYLRYHKNLPREALITVFPMIARADAGLKGARKSGGIIDSPLARLVSEILTA